MQNIKLGFGFMRLPMQKVGEKDEYNQELIKQLVDRFIEGGGTYFDTALVYGVGGSEKMLKMGLVDRYPRQSYTIADKLPLWFMEEKQLSLEEMFNLSLQNLGVDYLDYYLIHALSGDMITKAEEVGAWDFVQKLKAEGKVKHIGFSFHGTPDELNDLLKKHPEVEFVQLQLNYADWEDEKVASRRCYEIVTAHQKPVFVMEPVKGGTLANMGEFQRAPFEPFGKTPASFALRFAGSLDNVKVVLSGMNSMEQMDDNLATFKGMDFSPEEREAVEEVLKRLKSSKLVGCTACKYCVETCPMQIPIPQIFKAYNHYLTYGSTFDGWGRVKNVFGDAEHGPSNCIGCGECEAHCPQHLPIPDLMQEISKIQ